MLCLHAYVIQQAVDAENRGGRWKSVRAGLLRTAFSIHVVLTLSCAADVFAELLLDVPAQHLRKSGRSP